MSTLITGKGIETVQMLALKTMLELEISGLKRRGRTAYAIIKERYKLRGNKRSVYAQFCKIVEQESLQGDGYTCETCGSEVDEPSVVCDGCSEVND